MSEASPTKMTPLEIRKWWGWLTDASKANVAENASPEVWHAIQQAHRAGACDKPSPTKSYTREDLIRVVVGQQWAVAIEFEWVRSVIYPRPSVLHQAIGNLPCAVDVVDVVG